MALPGIVQSTCEYQSIWIVNVFEQKSSASKTSTSLKNLHEVKIKCKGTQEAAFSKILGFYMTESYVLFVLIEIDHRNSLCRIDLKTLDKHENGKRSRPISDVIFEYGGKESPSSGFLDMFVRGRDTASNHKLQAFFLHEDALYSWLEGDDQLNTVCLNVSSPFLTKISEDSFLMRSGESYRSEFKLFKVKAQFSSYSLDMVFGDELTEGDRYFVKGWAYDSANQVLVLLKVY